MTGAASAQPGWLCVIKYKIILTFLPQTCYHGVQKESPVS